MKRIEMFFLFMKDLFGWYWSPEVIRERIYHKCESVRELWCHHFDHDYYTYEFNKVRVFNRGTISSEYGVTTMRICKRCAHPDNKLYTQMPPVIF